MKKYAKKKKVQQMSIDQLTEFFSNISDRSITVEENLTGSIKDIYRVIETFKRKSDIGFCFYHKGDTKMAKETGKLYLSWGSYSEDEMDIFLVSNIIMEEGQACKLNISWGGAVTDRICISDIDVKYFDDILYA